MAGQNSIHLLRADSTKIAQTPSSTLSEGQPFYNTDKNYLTIGGGALIKL